MQRDLDGMADATHDLVVVGGGIAGAMIARDAALRGLSVALIEKDDFGGATTAGSSKLIHGGLRYLANLEIGLVREALRERRIWEAVAPHMVFPLPFLVAVRDGGFWSRLGFAAALTAYDLLAWDRNRLDDPDKRLPGHRWLGAEEAAARARVLDAGAIGGGILYHDCQMHFPERLCLEAVLGAAEQGARVANHAAVTGFVHERGPGSRVLGVEAEARGSARRVTVRGRVTVNAAGPWADGVMDLAAGRRARGLVRSKGIHMIVRDLTGGTAVAARSKTHGHVFILPWRGHSIVGTTDTPFDAAPDDLSVTGADIDLLLEKANDGFPGLGLRREDVLHSYAGLRPLVASEGGDGDTYSASRAAELVDHAAEGGPEGLLSAIGGKWTTARSLAEDAVDSVFAKLGRTAPPCPTRTAPTYGGDIGRYADFEARTLRQWPGMPEATVRRLVRNYGGRCDALLAAAKGDAGLLEPLAEGCPVTAVEVLHAVRHEMAETLADVAMRRTQLCQFGHSGDEVLRRAAAVMADELGWDSARQAAEVEAVAVGLAPRPAAG